MQGILIQKACLRNPAILTVINRVYKPFHIFFKYLFIAIFFIFTLNSKM